VEHRFHRFSPSRAATTVCAIPVRDASTPSTRSRRHAASVFPPLSPGAGNKLPRRLPVPDLVQVVLKIGFEVPERPPIPPLVRPYGPSPSDRPPTPPASNIRTAFPAASVDHAVPPGIFPVTKRIQPRMTRPPSPSPAITCGSLSTHIRPSRSASARRSVLSPGPPRVMPLGLPLTNPGPPRPETGQSISVRLPTFPRKM